MNKYLIIFLLSSLSVYTAPIVPPTAATPYTRQLLTNTTAVGARATLGIVGDTNSINVNGTIYSSANISNAFGSLDSNQKLVLSPGFYSVTNPSVADIPGLIVKDKHDIIIEGNGSIISAVNYGDTLGIWNCSNVIIRNITFTGDRSDLSNHVYEGISDETHFFVAGSIKLLLTNWNVTVENCSFVDVVDQAITAVGPYLIPELKEKSRCLGITIQHCYFNYIGFFSNEVWCVARQGDGACISGAYSDLNFLDNIIENGGSIVEVDLSQISSNPFLGKNLCVRGNKVLGFEGLFFLAAMNRLSLALSDVQIIDNIVISFPTNKTEKFIHIISPVTNIIISGNTFLNRNLDWVIHLNSYLGPIKGARILNNYFGGEARDPNQKNTVCIYLANTNTETVLISDNYFMDGTTPILNIDCSYWPMYFLDNVISTNISRWNDMILGQSPSYDNLTNLVFRGSGPTNQFPFRVAEDSIFHVTTSGIDYVFKGNSWRPSSWKVSGTTNDIPLRILGLDVITNIVTDTDVVIITDNTNYNGTYTWDEGASVWKNGDDEIGSIEFTEYYIYLSGTGKTIETTNSLLIGGVWTNSPGVLVNPQPTLAYLLVTNYTSQQATNLLELGIVGKTPTVVISTNNDISSFGLLIYPNINPTISIVPSNYFYLWNSNGYGLYNCWNSNDIILKQPLSVH